jgi:hypothetical protein
VVNLVVIVLAAVGVLLLSHTAYSGRAVRRRLSEG